MRHEEYLFTVCRQLFLEHLERLCYSSETSRGYEKDLLFFERFMKERGDRDFSMKGVEKEDLLKFMDFGRSLGHKVNTIARRLSTLKSFYKFLVYELDFPLDIAARIKVPKAYVPLTNILSTDEVQQLLRASSELSMSYHLFFSVLYYTGSRLTPVRTLKRSHVSLDKRIIYFPRVKGGKDLYLPLHECLVGMFEHYFSCNLSSKSIYVFPSKRLPHQPVSAADVRNKLRKAVQKAGLASAITPHTLRHCMATHLTIKKVEQQTIASILGHSDLRSTMRYQHLSVNHLREPINYL